MVTVVIAEKRSVAQAVAAALGGGVERDGMIVCDGMRVTWAQGHLVELAEPGEYRDEWRTWRLETLPIDPDAWRWRVDPRAKARWDAVRAIVGAPDVDALVNACDPDREGEAIFDRIVSRLGCRLPVRRLWVASLEADAIREAWTRMRAAGEYRGLRDAADIRAKADWLIGMNASRAYTLVHDARMNIGRVQTPTLAMVVSRDEAVEHHVPVPYWVAVAPMGGWHLESSRFDDPAAARAAAAAAAHGVRIDRVERRLVHERPPHLYDLTGLQKDMARMHGMGAAATLAALQGLYERKLATYPRTDSNWITHDDLPTLEALLRADSLVDRYAPAMRSMTARPQLTVDDARVAGHTAILPTMRAAGIDPGGLDRQLAGGRSVDPRGHRRGQQGHPGARRDMQVLRAGAPNIHPDRLRLPAGHFGAGDPAAGDGGGTVRPQGDMPAVRELQLVGADLHRPARDGGTVEVGGPDGDRHRFIGEIMGPLGGHLDRIGGLGVVLDRDALGGVDPVAPVGDRDGVPVARQPAEPQAPREGAVRPDRHPLPVEVLFRPVGAQGEPDECGQRLAAHPGFKAVNINDKRPNPDDLSFLFAAFTPNHRFNASNQLARRKRFDNIVVRPGL